MLLADGNGADLGPIAEPVAEPVVVDGAEAVIGTTEPATDLVQELIETQPVQETGASADISDGGFYGSVWFWGIIIALGLAAIVYVIKKVKK